MARGTLFKHFRPFRSVGGGQEARNRDRSGSRAAGRGGIVLHPFNDIAHFFRTFRREKLAADERCAQRNDCSSEPHHGDYV